MPKMPKWLGDFSEKVFKSAYKDTIISEIEYYHKNLKRVRYQGEILKSIEWTPAQEIEFRVTNTEYRHYTPSEWNQEEGYVDVIFYLHGKGIGSLWADNLKIGDKVTLIGPGGKFTLNSEEKNIIMIGDETTIGAYYGMQSTMKNDVNNICILEVNSSALNWHEKIGLNAIVLEAIPKQRGEASLKWLQNYLDNSENYKKYSFYLSGNADTVKKMRKLLRASGVNSKVIYSKPYWVEGKKGL